MEFAEEKSFQKSFAWVLKGPTSCVQSKIRSKKNLKKKLTLKFNEKKTKLKLEKEIKEEKVLIFAEEC